MSMKNHRSRAALRYLTLAGVVALAALLASPGDARAQAVEKPNITVGVFPITNYGLVYLGLQQGFFQAEGLNVTTRTMGGNPIAGIVGGDFDTGGVTWTAFLLALNRGISLQPISEADRGAKGQTYFMVRNDSSIKSVDDFIGKKVAVVTLGGACDLILNDIFLKKKLDYKSIGYTVMPIADMPPTLLRGGVDVACIPEPLYSAIAGQGNLRPVYDLFAGDYEGFPLIGFPVTQKFADSYPKTFAAMKRAFAKSLAFAHANPAKLREIYPTFTTLQPDLAGKITLAQTPEKSDFTKLREIADLMDRLQVLPEKTKLPDIATSK